MEILEETVQPERITQRTEAISVRFTAAEMAVLATAARGVGMPVRRFMREVILESLAVPNEKNLLLKAILQMDYRNLKYIEAASRGELNTRTVELIQAESEAIEQALFRGFVMRRGIPE